MKDVSDDWQFNKDISPCIVYIYFFPIMAQQPLVGQGLYISTVHDHTQGTPHSVGLLWTREQPVAETST
jgi:hypothetical protein